MIMALMGGKMARTSDMMESRTRWMTARNQYGYLVTLIINDSPAMITIQQLTYDEMEKPDLGWRSLAPSAKHHLGVAHLLFQKSWYLPEAQANF